TMKTSLLFVSTLSSSALARVAFNALDTDQQADVKSQLSKWKTLYAPLAAAHGYVPQVSIEFVGLVDSHTDEELARFHNTLQDVEDAQKSNPGAQFSPFNVFALLTQAEFDKVLKNSFAGKNLSDAKPLAATEAAVAAGGSKDWSTNKCNPPVRNQGQCGSCWAFSTVGTSEIAHCLATGELLDLAEQQVVSCDKASYGCNGGFPSSAIDFERKGLCLESAYPYTSGNSGQTGTCQSSCTKKTLSLGATVQTQGEDSLVTVLNTQPATVVVTAGNSVWRNYKGGVVTQCPSAESDHAVIAVGYGTSDKDFFKIKNSWGPQWGDNGYIYLQRGVGGKGTCNVVEAVVYPKLTASAPSNDPVPPTAVPTVQPTTTPTAQPTSKPTSQPTQQPTQKPTKRPTKKPTLKPTPVATKRPTAAPTTKPATSSARPTLTPTQAPTTTPATTRAPATTPAPTPSSPSTSLTGMQGQLISQTNKIRAAHGLGPVTWDAALSAKMQAYAGSCPGFNHGGPSGWQNLATNQACSGDACLKIVGAAWLWYNQEETKWNYNGNTCNGDWSVCGHFSNMMSPGVKQIACGWSQCSNGNYVWCNYVSAEMNPKVPRITGMTKDQLKASLTA
ncbi:unnamed protein product, partial [Aphanomyces euteiches]